LEAYTGIVTGFKSTDQGVYLLVDPKAFNDGTFQVTLLLSHSSTILDLIQRCLADDERSESTVRLCFGLIGDLADCFHSGQLKQLLLSEWVAAELRNKRGMSPETKKTMRWAREVRVLSARRTRLTAIPCRWSSVQPHRTEWTPSTCSTSHLTRGLIPCVSHFFLTLTV